MNWPMFFVGLGVLMLISSDILEALQNSKLASRHVVVAMVRFTLAVIIIVIEKAAD